MKTFFWFICLLFSLSCVSPVFPYKKKQTQKTNVSQAPAAPSVPQGDAEVDVMTALGTFKLDLYAKSKPQEVRFFLDNVKLGIYSGTIFHRIIDGFVIQGGAYDKNFHLKTKQVGVSGFKMNPTLQNTYGTIAFAARQEDPPASWNQFFINLENNSNLDVPAGGGYDVFGVVLSGMDVVQKLARVKIGQREGFYNVPFFPKEVLIQEVKIVQEGS